MPSSALKCAHGSFAETRTAQSLSVSGSAPVNLLSGALKGVFAEISACVQSRALRPPIKRKLRQ